MPTKMTYNWPRHERPEVGTIMARVPEGRLIPEQAIRGADRKRICTRAKVLFFHDKATEGLEPSGTAVLEVLGDVPNPKHLTAEQLAEQSAE